MLLEPEYAVLDAFMAEPQRDKYAGEVRAVVGLSSERISTYLRRLEKKGILESQRRGKQIFYHLNSVSALAAKCLGVLEFERALKLAGGEGGAGKELVQAITQALEAVGEHDFSFIADAGSLSNWKKSGVEITVVRSGVETLITTHPIPQVHLIIISKEEFGKKLAQHYAQKAFEKTRIVTSGEDAFWKAVLKELRYR